MAAPQGNFPPPGQEGYPPQQPQQQQYADPGSGYEQPGVADQPNAPPPDGTQQAGISHGGRKKRAYANEAFEFGAGANSALGGQPQVAAGYGGGYPAPAQPQGYPAAGYPEQAPQAAAGTYMGADQMNVGGYQPQAPVYPAQPAVGGVSQVTQQMGQMNMADQGPAQRGMPLNQLYPTDLVNQPFNVAELEYPPPPIVLPPNVSSCFSLDLVEARFPGLT